MSLLITIEGIDGSGKTTLIENLKKNLPNDLVITHNWRNTELGKEIWSLLDKSRVSKDKNLPSTWSYIFLIFVAFDELVKKIINPNLLADKIVIIDRYLDSTLVYQGLEGDLGVDILQEVMEKTINVPRPDITFVLDIDPQKAQERLNKRKKETGEYSNWDNLKLEFHQRIRNHYLELKKYFPERIYIINADRSETEILTEIRGIIKQVCSPQKNLPSLARVVIQNEKGEVLLVKDKKWDSWNYPGGRMEEGETPEEAAKREVFEETNLVVENLEQMAEEDIFFVNLPAGNQHWKGYFFRTNKYSGEIKNKEPEKILDIKFVDYYSPEAREARQAYQKLFRDTKNKKQ
jgi:dTMP kinase